jgi:hypothetical protein
VKKSADGDSHDSSLSVIDFGVQIALLDSPINRFYYGQFGLQNHGLLLSLIDC